ncbi:MAG: PepSY-associated TM helix domain-containing protein, partial [Alphaproteobacteria bacterium]|nr:PepSY-associated TM helix domain-containing protein [Alphaproteobacteria bacterium]
SIWKIDTGEAIEVSAMDMAVDPAHLPDEEALTRWAAKEFGVKTKPRAERPDGGARGKDERKRFMGAQRDEAEKWVQRFNQPNGRLTVAYVPGSRSVSVRQDADNVFGVLKNLHKGSGLGLAWILFIDTIAGALVAMSLTGFLLWTRLHGSRLLAGGIMLASLAFAVSATGPYML